MAQRTNAMLPASSNENPSYYGGGPQSTYHQFEGRRPSDESRHSGERRDDDSLTVASSLTQNQSFTISRRTTNPPSIVSIYEPKFYDIFLAYRYYVQQADPSIDLTGLSTQHLMTLCLNNLIPFSNWARDPAIQAFIKDTLFDHADMRPEVRSGLALVLVYTFSAARATAELDVLHRQNTSAGGKGPVQAADMFGVMMRSDSGLGIVNKTSLKIYNDPLQYFAFVKACLSGLIDAGAIPDNERLNTQPSSASHGSKRSRRESSNSGEVEAYHYLKTALVAMFQHPTSLKAAQLRIGQVLGFWKEKGDTIRYERFSCLHNVTFPNYTPKAATRKTPARSKPQTPTGVEGIQRLSDNSVPRVNSSDSIGNYNRSRESSGGSQKGQVVVTTTSMLRPTTARASIRMSNSYDEGNSYVPAVSMSRSNSGQEYAVPRSRSLQEGDITDGVPNVSALLRGSKHNFSGTKITPTYSAEAYHRFPPPPPPEPVPCIRYERTGALRWKAVPTQVRDVGTLSPTLLPKLNTGAHYLVDEVKLQAYLSEIEGNNESMDIVLTDSMRSSGVFSLATLLQKSGSIVSHWSSRDYPQFRGFVESWSVAKAPSVSCEKAESLAPTGEPVNPLGAVSVASVGSEGSTHSRPNRRRPSKEVEDAIEMTGVTEEDTSVSILSMAIHIPDTVMESGADVAGPADLIVVEEARPYDLIDYWAVLTHDKGVGGSTDTTRGKGVIVFERSQEVGLVLRANPELKLAEESWCLTYFEDLSAQLSCGEAKEALHGLLATLLPQAQPVLRIDTDVSDAMATDDDAEAVEAKRSPLIRYYSHKGSSGALDVPPLAPPLAEYHQWSGEVNSIDEITSQFTSDTYFLDMFLQ